VADRLVLCYHGVSEHWPSHLAVAPEQLEEQLALLVSRGYQGRTFFDTLAAHGHGRYVAITFDDAYRSVFELAFPILRAAGLPATVFAPTGLVGTEAPMRWRGVEEWLDTPHATELVGMSWDQLRELADAGWEIGSHSRHHARLTELGDSNLAEELSASRQECELRIGRRCLTLAYPYGAVDGRVVLAAQAAGYEAAGAPVRRLPGPRTMHWPRMGIYRQDNLRRVRAKVSPAMRRLYASPAWGPLTKVAGGRLGGGRAHVS
jgi:peptidoglycan/xylan/chitin deacetylase (PgdA/CDA1 family)